MLGCIILPVHNRMQVTMDFLQMIDKERKRLQIDVVVVDDGSVDGTSRAIKSKFPDVTVLVGDGNLWWAGGVNLGFEYCVDKYSYCIIANDDIKFVPGTLTRLVGMYCCGCNQLYGVVTLDCSTGKVVKSGMESNPGYYPRVRDVNRGKSVNQLVANFVVDTVSSRLLLVPCSVIHEIGVFDAARFPHNFSDLEYGLRAKTKGIKTVICVDCCIYTEEDCKKSFFFSLKNMTRKEFLRSFTDIRFPWMYKSLLRFCFCHQSLVRGGVSFLLCVAALVKWVGVKLLATESLRGYMLKGKISC
ncbi:glycosyltransferase [Desulfovibrio mangrovi]|uniref:glycosyltransferase family 2 protein n=1 Tax=Desulfovibrio mangrovi TaxID=2976983 RepID=UPI002247B59E|nr:glycosyltransferase [Desulfovibrio mangrovi]UZP67611.1 glycosyltransferase [Desulfovibrio mangrovi]